MSERWQDDPAYSLTPVPKSSIDNGLENRKKTEENGTSGGGINSVSSNARFVELKAGALDLIHMAETECDPDPALLSCMAETRELLGMAKDHLSDPSTSGAEFPAAAQLVECLRGLTSYIAHCRRIRSDEVVAMVAQVFDADDGKGDEEADAT